MSGLCEARWYHRNYSAEVSNACDELSYMEIDGRRLCYVHASVVRAGHATLAQVLRGERPSLVHDYRGATERAR